MESTSYFFSFRVVGFLLCDHGLDFLHQLTNVCGNSIIKSVITHAVTNVRYSELQTPQALLESMYRIVKLAGRG